MRGWIVRTGFRRGERRWFFVNLKRRMALSIDIRRSLHRPGEYSVGRPFMLDEKLSEDERMIRDIGRAHARERLPLSVTAAVLKNKVDRDVFHEMGEFGLTGLTLREAFGCANAPSRRLRRETWRAICISLSPRDHRHPRLSA
jgi:hypothetical protein